MGEKTLYSTAWTSLVLLVRDVGHEAAVAVHLKSIFKIRFGRNLRIENKTGQMQVDIYYIW
jgi:hypothetical protein